MENRIEDLETKISYQEHLVQELNEVVTGQQNQIDALEKLVNQLRDYLQNNESEQTVPAQEAPPHY